MMTFAIVAAFHVAVVVTFIVALRPHWIPTFGLTDIHAVIPKTPTTPPQPRPPIGQTVLINPTAPPVQKPDWTVKDPNAQPITQPPSGANGDTQSLPTRNPVSLFSTHTPPPYPLLERRLGNEGNVQLRLTIDADGEVTDAEIVRSSGYDELDQAAASWVKAHWRYLPALQNGQPVAATTTALVTFRLTSH
jgi:protein TonB